MGMRSQLSFRPQLNHLECRTVPSIVPNNALVIGASVGSEPFVFVLEPNTNKEVFRFMPFESSFRGGVSVATGDVYGDDGVQDIVVAAASGGGPRIAIYDGATGQVVQDYFVYEPTFNGGLDVAVGDVNGDENLDIIVGAGSGGGPRVTALDVSTGNTLTVLEDFFAFEPTFRGGVDVGSDDVNGDGNDDIVVGAGFGGAPRVTVFEGGQIDNVLLNFFAYDPVFRNGVRVDAVDFDGDDLADILIGSGTGGAPHVRVISGANGVELENFFAFDSNLRGGARVAAVDTNGDFEADTLVVGTPGHLRRFFKAAEGNELIAEDINVIDTGRGVFLGGAIRDFRRGDVQQTIGGVVAAVNPDLGTVTIRTGRTGTLAVFPIHDDTVLLRDGETVALDAFQEGDVAIVRIGPDRQISTLVAVSSATGDLTAPALGRTIEGVVVAVNDSDDPAVADSIIVMSRNGTLYEIEVDDGTVFNRYGLADTLLADFRPGDFVEVRVGEDGLANRIATLSGNFLGGTGGFGDDDGDGNGTGTGDDGNGTGTGTGGGNGKGNGNGNGRGRGGNGS